VSERDLVVTASRAGGHGGQSVNKVATAVRVHHVPSGISVRVTSERSQRQNIRIAMARISASSSSARAASPHREIANALLHARLGVG
jgi:protein subunit release factor B